MRLGRIAAIVSWTIESEFEFYLFENLSKKVLT